MHFERVSSGSSRKMTPCAPQRKASITRSRSREASSITARVFDCKARSSRNTRNPSGGPSCSCALMMATSGWRSFRSATVCEDCTALATTATRKRLGRNALCTRWQFISLASATVASSHSHRMSGYRPMQHAEQGPCFAFYGLGSLVSGFVSCAAEKEGLIVVAALGEKVALVQLEVRPGWLDESGFGKIPAGAGKEEGLA